jgi:hypothetical protein
MLNKINTSLLLIGSFCENAEGFKTYHIPKITASIILIVPNILGAFIVNDFSLTLLFFLICLLKMKRNKTEAITPEMSVNKTKYNIFPPIIYLVYLFYF